MRCYHCHEIIGVAERAQSASCSRCHKQLTTRDISIRGLHWGGELRTTGDVTIERKARATCKRVEASGRVTVLGTLEAAAVSSGVGVVLGPGAVVRGVIEAPELEVCEGAVLEGGFRQTRAVVAGDAPVPVNAR